MAVDSETNLSFPCPAFLAAHHQSNVTFSVPLGHLPFLPQADFLLPRPDGMWDTPSWH